MLQVMLCPFFPIKVRVTLLQKVSRERADFLAIDREPFNQSGAYPGCGAPGNKGRRYLQAHQTADAIGNDLPPPLVRA